jgi:hypothetical protein
MYPMHHAPVAARCPLPLRLVGLWIIWSAWCQVSGWGLSLLSALNAFGYLALLPGLLMAAGWWWQVSGGRMPPVLGGSARKWWRRLRQPLPAMFLVGAGISLLTALAYTPWSFDAVSYRLPRILYWWIAGHWYWIGTLDHRLDYSSTGFEWQMLPLIVLAHTDRLIFLLNWVPFVLMPGLVFAAFRACGVSGRSARRWMWLLPAAFCYALQSGGLQNDGYSVNYLLAAVAFSWLAQRRGRSVYWWLAGLAVALLLGAKLSNLPLLLPLGVLWLAVARRSWWTDWRFIGVAGVTVICSFLPLAILCWQQTGDWTGDPHDQWSVKARHPLGAAAANLSLLARDAVQPPYFPPNAKVDAWLSYLNQSPPVLWMIHSHGQFAGLHFGGIVYEGQAGLGCGVAGYLLFLGIVAVWPVRPGANFISVSRPPGFIWRLTTWLAWPAFLVYLMKLGSEHPARIAVAYYPLLIVTLLRCPKVCRAERGKISGWLAGFAALAVLPVLLLTPARPLLPAGWIAQHFPVQAMAKIADQYRFWDIMRDDLAPLRARLPADVRRLGYAGGFRDTAYGLWKPFGTRKIVELGLPVGRPAAVPSDLRYVVATAAGVKQRFALDWADWLAANHAQVVFQFNRNRCLNSSEAPDIETWYLVRFTR